MTNIRLRSHEDKKGYYVAKDPYGRYALIKVGNTRYLGKGWKVYFSKHKKFYNKDGSLTELVHCLQEITSYKHANWFTSPRNISLGIVFGRTVNAKGTPYFY